MERVLLHYDSGHCTSLGNHPRLAEMLRNLGEPDVIERGPWRTYMEWPPIYPGVPIPSYCMSEPWPSETPRRKLVRISLDTISHAKNWK